jgi:hypothetical protein
MGKVTVIKKFALPNIIYPFTVLENPPNYTIKDIISTLFLWDGKTDKISVKLLQTITMLED